MVQEAGTLAPTVMLDVAVPARAGLTQRVPPRARLETAAVSSKEREGKRDIAVKYCLINDCVSDLDWF